ncbi:hypothetical protein B0H17DRAFT_1202710 [Mycena rosella]|uniref:Uncharacterized protein n=1 Tax=Mycena rosella TaxID=1033263 RepID=A0AAD7DG99_MYCRO|nr:hypothetical protein B0H17DRAFT_1202710 [Mycena rosella]
MGYISIISSTTAASPGAKLSANADRLDGPDSVTPKKKAGPNANELSANADDLDGVDDEPPAFETATPKKKGKRSKAKRKRKRVRAPGLFSNLRDACMATTRALAELRMIGLVYDNINLMNRIAERILGRKSAQENGTCATGFPLHNAQKAHLLAADLDGSILNAPRLTLDDIVLHAADTEFLAKNMVHTRLRL